jgi:hypothetical protein
MNAGFRDGGAVAVNDEGAIFPYPDMVRMLKAAGEGAFEVLVVSHRAALGDTAAQRLVVEAELARVGVRMETSIETPADAEAGRRADAAAAPRPERRRAAWSLVRALDGNGA